MHDPGAGRDSGGPLLRDSDRDAAATNARAHLAYRTRLDLGG